MRNETHRGLLALEHEDLRRVSAGLLHSYCEQRVVDTAIQNSFGLHDAAERYGLQLRLQDQSKQPQIHGSEYTIQ